MIETIMPIACICGGIVELGLIGLAGMIVTYVTAWVNNRNNRRKCVKANCQHNCKD